MMVIDWWAQRYVLERAALEKKLQWLTLLGVERDDAVRIGAFALELAHERAYAESPAAIAKTIAKRYLRGDFTPIADIAATYQEEAVRREHPGLFD